MERKTLNLRKLIPDNIRRRTLNGALEILNERGSYEYSQARAFKVITDLAAPANVELEPKAFLRLLKQARELAPTEEAIKAFLKAAHSYLEAGQEYAEKLLLEKEELSKGAVEEIEQYRRNRIAPGPITGPTLRQAAALKAEAELNKKKEGFVR